MRRTLRAVLLLASSLTLLAAPMSARCQTLEELEGMSKQQEGSFDYKRALETSDRIGAGVEALVQNDGLQSESDFRRAGTLTLFMRTRDLGFNTRTYQLLLTALAMGDMVAGQSLPVAWDALMGCTGRPHRIVSQNDGHDQDLAPELVRQVYTKSRKADDKPAGDNGEVQRIVDEDQKARGNFSDLTQEQLMQMMKADRARLARIKEIVFSKDGLKTAKDFANAALVCQHGELFLDYALAHELSVCSLLLGNKDANWLAGASYDRMLMSGSYPQRFATQYDGNWTLRPYTTEGVNDRMRKTVVRKTLEEAKARTKP